MTKETQIRFLVLDYLHRNEEFDRSVCSYITKQGVAMPISPSENRLIQTHWRKAQEQLFYRAANINVRVREIKNAIQYYSHEYEKIGFEAFEISEEWKRIREHVRSVSHVTEGIPPYTQKHGENIYEY